MRQRRRRRIIRQLRTRALIAVARFLLPVLLAQDPPPPDSAPPPRTTVLPVVSWSDVTGVQYGATLFRTSRAAPDPRTRPSSGALYAARTGKGYAKAYAQVERWAAANVLRTRVRIEHISYPLPFFGIGASAPDDAEEWYSHGVTTVHALVQRRVRSQATYLLGGLRYIHTRAGEAEPSGAIADGSLPGSSGSRVAAAELGVVLDERENLTAPRGGTYARLVASAAARVVGANVSYRRLTLDARRYVPLGVEHLIALQIQYDGVAGLVPFDQLPMLGADTAMRGYARGRYRDRHAVTAQVELRTGYWRRAGTVAFLGAGTVAPDRTRLTSGRWFPTAGVGVRALLIPRDRTVARVDLGIGRRSVGVSVGLGEAF